MLFNYWLADCFGHASGQLTVCPLWCPMFTDLPGSFLAFSESFQLHINCFVSSFERHLFSSCLFYPFYYVNFLFSKKFTYFQSKDCFLGPFWAWAIFYLWAEPISFASTIRYLFFLPTSLSPLMRWRRWQAPPIASIYCDRNRSAHRLGIDVIADSESIWRPSCFGR